MKTMCRNLWVFPVTSRGLLARIVGSIPSIFSFPCDVSDTFPPSCLDFNSPHTPPHPPPPPPPRNTSRNSPSPLPYRPSPHTPTPMPPPPKFFPLLLPVTLTLAFFIFFLLSFIRSVHPLASPPPNPCCAGWASITLPFAYYFTAFRVPSPHGSHCLAIVFFNTMTLAILLPPRIFWLRLFSSLSPCILPVDKTRGLSAPSYGTADRRSRVSNPFLPPRWCPPPSYPSQNTSYSGFRTFGLNALSSPIKSPPSLHYVSKQFFLNITLKRCSLQGQHASRAHL